MGNYRLLQGPARHKAVAALYRNHRNFSTGVVSLHPPPHFSGLATWIRRLFTGGIELSEKPVPLLLCHPQGNNFHERFPKRCISPSFEPAIMASRSDTSMMKSSKAHGEGLRASYKLLGGWRWCCWVDFWVLPFCLPSTAAKS